jgi:hypothetical protein
VRRLGGTEGVGYGRDGHAVLSALVDGKVSNGIASTEGEEGRSTMGCRVSTAPRSTSQLRLGIGQRRDRPRATRQEERLPFRYLRLEGGP